MYAKSKTEMMGDTIFKMRDSVSLAFSIHIMRDIVLFMFSSFCKKAVPTPWASTANQTFFQRCGAKRFVPAYVIIIAYFGMFVKIFSRPLSALIWR